MENLGALGQQSFNLRVNGVSPETLQSILRQGQLLTGEVLQKLDGHSVVLLIGQNKVIANTRVELDPGQVFRFRVTQEGSEVVFKVVPEKQSAGQQGVVDFFKHTAAKDLPPSEIFRRLAQVLLVASKAGGSSSASPVPLPKALDGKAIAFLENILQAASVRLYTEHSAQGTPAPAVPGASGPLPNPGPLVSAAVPNLIPAEGVVAQAQTNQVPLETILPTAAGNEAAADPLPSNSSIQVQSPVAKESLENLISKLDPFLSDPDSPTKFEEKPGLTAPQYSELKIPFNLSQSATQSLAFQDLHKAIPFLKNPSLLLRAREIVDFMTQAVLSEDVKPEAIQRNVEQQMRSLEGQLRQFFEGESLATPEQSGSRDLKSRLVGLEFELGKALRESKEQGNFEEQKAIKDLLTRVQEARQGLEAKQVENVLRKDMGEPMHIQIPFFEGAVLKNADFYYQQKESAKEGGDSKVRTHHLLFLLEMSGLGPLRVDAIVKENRLDLQFRLENAKAAHFLRDRLSHMSAALEGLGFEVGHLQCSAGSCPKQELRTDIQLPVYQERRLLDLEG